MNLKRIALLTSGGDAPGMNPCIRAIVHESVDKGIEVIGIRRGFAGLLDNDFVPMKRGDVSGIIHRSGTALLSSRCDDFKYEEGQREGLKNLPAQNCDGLIVIGGDGSLRGAKALSERNGISVIGIPGSIDNDIFATDMALGVDTALNNIVRVIDMIKDTASSHERTFIIEVMGRGSGYLALVSALATGSEAAIIPEVPYDMEKIAARLLQRFQRKANLNIIVVAEGAATAYHVARELSKIAGLASKVTVLGHLQRGGSPSTFDRVLGARLGSAAICRLLMGESNCMVGLIKNEVVSTPLDIVLKNRKLFDQNLIQLAETLGN
jgi:6-phosphofructokinase 1